MAARHRGHRSGQHRDRVVDAGQHQDQVDAGPREGLGPRAEQRDQRADQHADDPRGEEAAGQEGGDRAPAPAPARRSRRPTRRARPAARRSTKPRSMPTSQAPTVRWRTPIGRHELVLDRLRPHVEQHRVGDLELADVDDRQRDGAHQHEGALLGRQAEEARHEADREHADDRPERAARRRRTRCARP